MKHKYQSSLSRRLVASGLAAVFSAGAFGSYVGAMNVLEGSQIIERPEYENVEVGTKITVGNKFHHFNNIPSDKISSDFTKYVKSDPEFARDSQAKDEIANGVFQILNDLVFLCDEHGLKVSEVENSLEQTMIYDEKGSVSYGTLSEKGYFNDFVNDFPKPFDILYFIERKYLKFNKAVDEYGDLLRHIREIESYDPIILEFLPTLHEKIRNAAKKYFEDEKKLKEVKKFLILFLVAALFSAGSMVVYNYSNINKQEDKDSSKKEPIHKDQNSTGKIQNSAGENKDSKDQTQKAVDVKQKSKGKTQNPAGENKNSTGKTQKAANE